MLCFMSRFAFMFRSSSSSWCAATERRRPGREVLQGGGALARSGIPRRIFIENGGKRTASDSGSSPFSSLSRYRRRHASERSWKLISHRFAFTANFPPSIYIHELVQVAQHPKFVSHECRMQYLPECHLPVFGIRYHIDRHEQWKGAT